MNSERRSNNQTLLIILLSAVIVILMIWVGFSIKSKSIIRNVDIDMETYATLTKEELENAKLQQEIRNLVIQNNIEVTPLQRLSSFADNITAIIAIAGAFIAIWKQIKEQENARRQREAESLRNLDTKFTSIIKDLSSDNISIQVTAIVMLSTFLKEEFSSFYNQVYEVIIAHLKINQNMQARRLLIQTFEKAIRLKLKKNQESETLECLDLTNAYLYNADLRRLDLTCADIAFADLRDADFTDGNLFRVKGIEANLKNCHFINTNLQEGRLDYAIGENAHFGGAKLISATLKHANLKYAKFYDAKLQSAHLENSDLRGARFDGANINDAYFIDADMTKETLTSITKAKNWRKAHFDDRTKRKLGI
jgi:uncharacterized protein YjbI with pentapeptide repeats